MNVLGKVFVIANLVFSVAAAGLIMLVYATRTNWHAAYVQMDTQAKTAKANADAYADLVQKTKAEENAKVEELKKQLSAALIKAEETRKNHEAISTQLDAQKALYDKQVQEAKGIAEVNNRLQKESALVKSQLGDSNKKIVDLEKEKSTFRNRAVTAEIAADQEKETNQRLLADNETLVKELEGAKRSVVGGGNGRPGTTTKNPPLEDLDGLIEKIDPKSQYVEITLGSNHGLKRDQTLEVFRLKPEGKYLGTIKILEVRADKAVGYPVGRPLAQIQVGDRVASRIQAGRFGF